MIYLKYIGYFLGVVSLGLWYWLLFVKERKNVLEQLKGEDLRWQVIELSGLMWLIIMPACVVADMLGAHIQNMVWGAMDTVYLINVGGKAYLERLKAKKNGSES